MKIMAVSEWFNAQIRWHSANSILNSCPYFYSGNSLLMNMKRTWKRKLFNTAQATCHPICFEGSAGFHLLWVCRKDNQLLQQQTAKARIIPFSDISCLNKAIYWCQQQRATSIWRQSQQSNSLHLRMVSHHHPIPHTYTSDLG